jgi:hypothetical protein
LKTKIYKFHIWYKIKPEPLAFSGFKDLSVTDKEVKACFRIVRCGIDITGIQYFYEVAAEDRCEPDVEETTLIFKSNALKLDIAMPIQEFEKLYLKHHASLQNKIFNYCRQLLGNLSRGGNGSGV